MVRSKMIFGFLLLFLGIMMTVFGVSGNDFQISADSVLKTNVNVISRYVIGSGILFILISAFLFNSVRCDFEKKRY